MTGMTEMELCRWLLTKFRGLGFHATRIENAVIGGIPDIYLCLRGQGMWIETKVSKNKQMSTELRASQYKWHKEHTQAGGNSYVLIYNKETEDIAMIEAHEFVFKPSLTVQSERAKLFASRKAFIEKFVDTFLIRTDL